MATRVGQAYVSVTADGSAINNDILKSVDDVKWDRVAKKHGQKFGSHLQTEFDAMSDRLGKQLGNGLSRAITRDDATGASVRKMVEDAFTAGKTKGLVAKVTRDAGGASGKSFGAAFDAEATKAVGEALEKSLRKAAKRGEVFTDVFSSLGEGGTEDARLGPVYDDAVAQATKALRRLEKERDADTAAAEQAAKDNERIVAATLAARENLQRKSADNLALAREQDQKKLLAEQERTLRNAEAVAKQQINLTNAVLKARRKLADDSAAAEAKWAAQQQKITQKAAREAASVQFDDRVFAQAAKRFEARFKSIRLDPRIDPSALRVMEQQVLKMFADREKFSILMEADLPDREISEIRQKIATLDRDISVRLDRRALNRDLMAVTSQLDSRISASDVGASVGRLFGSGARNNALNSLGRTIGGVTSGLVTLSRAGQGAFSAFQAGARMAGEGASFLQKGMSGLQGVAAAGSGAMASLAAALPAIAVGAVVAIAVLSILASVISALTGLVVALASTIVSALTGALIVLGGALGAVVVAGGLLTATFMSMTNAQKAMMSESFSPLRDMMTGLGQIMLEDLIPAFNTWSANMQGGLALLIPVAERMGSAFGEAGNQITAAFSGPGFQKLSASLATFLPGIVTALGGALGKFLDGMAASFSAILPYVLQFSEYLERVATTFSNFANSEEGQDKITDFVERSLVALQSLWGFVTEFFGFLGDVLYSPAGQDAGNTIFDSFARSFEGFRAKIGDGALERWFAQAIEFGGSLKEVLSGLGDAFAWLSSSGTLEAIQISLKALAETFEFLVDVGKAAYDVVTLWGLTDKLGLTNVRQESEALIDTSANHVDMLQQVGAAYERLGELSLGELQSLQGGFEALGMTGTSEYARVVDATISAQAESNNLAVAIEGMAARSNVALGGVISYAGQAALAIANAARAASNVASGAVTGAAAGAGVAASVSPSGASAVLQRIEAERTRRRLEDLRQSGSDARAATSRSSGGTMPDPDKAANAAAKRAAANAAKRAAQERARLKKTRNKAMRDLSFDTRKEIKEIAKIADGDKVKERLGSLSTKLAEASFDNQSPKNVRKINRARKKIMEQQKFDMKNVDRLVAGGRIGNATMTELAGAREIVAEKLDAANDRLKEAVEMRDSYRDAIEDSIKSFGALGTTQGKIVDGVEQAITAVDITENLRGRLAKIREFQQTMNSLRGLGLGDSAYKQILDMGVEEGSSFADALISGGYAAVSEVNSLTGMIDKEAAGMGNAVSNQLYQAGVNAAQGLVDGLESISADLESAATRLGNSIARAIKKALNIKSPSRVMFEMMGFVGDGLEDGLDAQDTKVGGASRRLGSTIVDNIQPTPHLAQMVTAGAAVSGNSETPNAVGSTYNLTVVTPTEDPVAVATETMNELTGRLLG